MESVKYLWLHIFNFTWATPTSVIMWQQNKNIWKGQISENYSFRTKMQSMQNQETISWKQNHFKE